MSDQKEHASETVITKNPDIEECSHTPNATTIRAMDELKRGDGMRFKNAEALFDDLGISN